NDTATTEISTLSLHDALPILVNDRSTVIEHGPPRPRLRPRGISGAKLNPRRRASDVLGQHVDHRDLRRCLCLGSTPSAIRTCDPGPSSGWTGSRISSLGGAGNVHD